MMVKLCMYALQCRFFLPFASLFLIVQRTWGSWKVWKVWNAFFKNLHTAFKDCGGYWCEGICSCSVRYLTVLYLNMFKKAYCCYRGYLWTSAKVLHIWKVIMHSNCSLELGTKKYKSALKYLKLTFYLFLKSVSSSTWPFLWVTKWLYKKQTHEIGKAIVSNSLQLLVFNSCI